MCPVDHSSLLAVQEKGHTVSGLGPNGLRGKGGVKVGVPHIRRCSTQLQVHVPAWDDTKMIDLKRGTALVVILTNHVVVILTNHVIEINAVAVMVAKKC